MRTECESTIHICELWYMRRRKGIAVKRQFVVNAVCGDAPPFPPKTGLVNRTGMPFCSLPLFLSSRRVRVEEGKRTSVSIVGCCEPRKENDLRRVIMRRRHFHSGMSSNTYRGQDSEKDSIDNESDWELYCSYIIKTLILYIRAFHK